LNGSFDHEGAKSRRRGADVAAAIYRAQRAIRFYPASHPSTTEALERLEAVLREATADESALTLDVREQSFVLDETVLIGADDPRSAIAHAMYLDGVRSITFHPGISQQEATAFIQVLAQAEDSDRLDHDMATMLWELDLPHISLTIADPLLDEHAWEGKGNMIESVRDELTEAAARSPLEDLGSPVEPILSPPAQEIYRRLLAEAPATPEEIERLVSAEEHGADILTGFLEVLIEVLGQAASDSEVSSVAHSISDVLASYLEWGQYAAVTSSVQRLEELARLQPERRGVVGDIIAGLAAPEALRAAVFGLDSRPEDRSDLEDMLYAMRGATYPAIVGLLSEAEDQTARKCLLNVCTRGDGVPSTLVVPHLADPRWYVVRNMLYILAAVGDRNTLDHVEPTLAHTDERVRRESVRALQSIGGERAADLIAGRLKDEASSVRILAARGLPGVRGGEAAAILLEHMSSRAFDERSPAEVQAFFEVVSEEATDDAIPALSGLWSAHSRLRARPSSVKLGALRVVATMGSEASRRALEQAARSTDEEVRRHAHVLLERSRAKGSPTTHAAIGGEPDERPSGPRSQDAGA
jgi:HEAT repeat protein